MGATGAGGGRGAGGGFFAVQTLPLHSQCAAFGAAAHSSRDVKHGLQGGFGQAHGGVGGGAGPVQIVQREHLSHAPQSAHEQSEPLNLPGWQSQNGPSNAAQGTCVAEAAGRANMSATTSTVASSSKGGILLRRHCRR